DLDDAHAYRELARKVSISSAEIMEFMFINHDSNSHIVDVRGVEPEMFALRGVEIESGRAIAPDDIRLARHVAVIGQTARTRLLSGKSPVDEWININGERFVVVGMLKLVGVQLSR